MKKIYLLAISLFATMGAFTSCSNEDFDGAEGEGKISLSVALDNDVKVVSRATGEDINALMEDFQLYIYSHKGLIRKYHKASELPTEGLWLVSGNYQAVVWAGDSTDASYTNKYFMGKTNFTISKGSTESVQVVGKIQNTVASVILPDELRTLMPDMKMTIGTSAATLDFDYSNFESAKGYYMIPKGETDLQWTLTGTNEDGSEFRKTGSVQNAKSATEYQFKIIYQPTTGEGTGGAALAVRVDESEIPVGESITVTSAPKIIGSGFDISQPVFSAAEKFETKLSVYVTASAKLESIVLNCDNSTAWDAATGITGSSSFDLLKANANVLAQLKVAGVYIPASTDAEGQGCGYNEANDEDIEKIVFSKALLNRLVNGSYNITITATDVNGKTRTGVLDIEVSEASVVTGEALTVRQASAVISANIAKSEATGFAFNLREKGTSEWTKITAVAIDDARTSFTAAISNLKGGTTYEYQALCDGFVSTIINTFTTVPNFQMPNSSFEEWQTGSGSSAYLVYASGTDMFWDTGNHGSATMKKQLSTPDNTIKHSGAYSIKMKSQFVGIGSIGAFAAGNLFSGQYLETIMSTKTGGVIGFGRPFVQDDGPRPTKLRGYVKYECGKVDYPSSGRIERGADDIGVVYIAMFDENVDTYTSAKGTTYTNWGAIVDTTEERLFDKNASNVMGYGELEFTSSTAGDGLIEFEVPIVYGRDGMPKRILVVASASKYGDYFAGSSGSTMWLDDLELVYE